MAELAVAVLVCNVEGRILLYNAAARAVLGDDAAIGLGRSVFGIVDRGLVEPRRSTGIAASAAHVARGHGAASGGRAAAGSAWPPVAGAGRRTLAGFVLSSRT